MSTLGLTNTLMSVFVPLGIAGAAIAVVCALVAAFALMRGAAGLAGGAIGVWIVGAVLSVSASFGNVWMPAIVALAALAGALALGGAGRLLAFGVHRAAAPRTAAVPAPVATTATSTVRTQPATLKTGVVPVTA